MSQGELLRAHEDVSGGVPEPVRAPDAGRTDDIGRDALRGAAALVVRQVFAQGANFAGALLLARLLSPGEFGLFGIATFGLSALLQLGGAGLATSLVRQAEEPDDDDCRVVFTLQQVVVLIVTIALWLGAPAVARAYGRPLADLWTVRLVALAAVCASLQTIPTARLERRLAFASLAGVEVAQALLYNVIAVFLAWRGAGTLAIGVAFLARAAFGAMLVSLVSPWRIGWRWDLERARRHLRFGLPMQGIGLVSMVKDSITPVLLGLTGGAAAVGYIGWAQLVATYPTWAVMVMQRVYLPTFARVQHDERRLASLVEEVVRLSNTAVAPLAMLTLVLIRPLTTVVFGAQWLPALSAFRLLWIANLLVPTTMPLLGLLNASGRSRTAFGFALAWMVATWALGVPLIAAFGPLGFALANVGVQGLNLLLIRAARRIVPIRVLSMAGPVWLWAAATSLVGAALHATVPGAPALRLAFAFGAALALYAAGLALAAPAALRQARTWLAPR